MTLASPAALYLALSALVLMALALLRPQLKRRHVSSLFLWEGLKHDARSRKIHFRQLLDPLLLLQVLSVLLLVAALADPLLSSTRQRLSALAIVIDGSASMQTMTEDGSTRYDLAIDAAKKIAGESPAISTSVIQLSSLAAVLANAAPTRAFVTRALDDSEPTWNRDGTIDDMVNALSALGGLSSFDRVVLLTDREVASLPVQVEQITVSGGENLAVTGFSVRENPAGEGATAFVEVLNDTSADHDVTLRVSDGSAQTSVPVYLTPGTNDRVIVPFPTSRGTVFTVVLDVEDALPEDNVRYFALDRPLDLRVRWIGPPNRYLSAALGAVTPFSVVSAAEEADITIVHQATLPSSYGGSILLVNSEVDGVATLGDERDRSSLRAVLSSHPLLDGLRPEDIRVFSSPSVSLPQDATIILETDGEPLLATWQTETQDVTLFSARLETTNLPLAVDLPLLIRNVASRVVRLPAALAYEWMNVGDPVSLLGRGSIQSLEDPDQRKISVSQQDMFFFPDAPGLYTLITDRAVFPLAVNVAASESSGIGDWNGGTAAAAVESAERRSWIDVWPLLAGVGVALLLGELVLRKRSALRLPGRHRA
jgi:hypothetical protein